ncbi:MAG: response regulator transcription factor [Anaerolineales bacterium]
MTHIKIMIADDHKLVRQGLRSLLEAQPGLTVIGEANDGQEALQCIEKLAPDVALLDVMMPNLNGIEAAKLARQRGYKTKIVFLSMHANAMYAVRALQSGALGYVLKDADFAEILQAIQSALAGKRYISPRIADEVFDLLLNHEDGTEDSIATLSPREREVLQLIAEGNTNAAIAEKLSLSPRTVESHRANIVKKLKFNSQADLVKYAISHGLITP